MEMTTNQSVVDEDGDVVVEKKCKDWVGSANKCPVGTKRVKQKIWDYFEQDNKQQRNHPNEDNDKKLTCITRSTCGILLYHCPRNVSMDDAVNVQLHQ